jgi:23S rRNA (uracil1939-C5)-methyltransferase
MSKRQHSRFRRYRQQPQQEQRPAIADAPAASTLEVEIERILPGGAGLAHADGRTILVGLAAPGDVVRVRVESVRGKTAFASITEIIKPSTQRIEPPCPYFGRCGGCDFQQLDYAAQLEAKVGIIRDCLRRIARIETPFEIPINASPRAWHYRSRAQWQHDAITKRLGYFERGTHSVCDVVECPVLVPQLQAILSDLRDRMNADTLPEGVEDFQAVAGDDGASLVPFVDENFSSEARREIGGFRYRFNAAGFFQINHELLGSLIAYALKDTQSGNVALDLYCGVGLFTLPLAKKFKRVIGIEAVAAAVIDARRNVEEAQLANAEIECASVGDWLQRNARDFAPVDHILLDPPRAGAEGSAVEGIIALRPRRITYVSCDPATLARDLKILLAGGYHLADLAAFDMFPQTHHVETIAHLTLLT